MYVENRTRSHHVRESHGGANEYVYNYLLPEKWQFPMKDF